MIETPYEHIVLSDDQIPMIATTKIKVVEVVLDHLAYGWSPEEIHFQHPQMTMGQIHSAFAYYWDHKVELDQEIKEGLEYVEQVKRTIRQPHLK